MQYLVEAKLKLETRVLHLTLVDVGSCSSTEIRGHRTFITRDEDIITVVAEPVETTCKHTMKECIVETDICLLHCSPTQVGIGYGLFLVTLEWTLTVIKGKLELVGWFPNSKVSPA